MIAPIFAQLAERHPNVLFLKVDVDGGQGASLVSASLPASSRVFGASHYDPSAIATCRSNLTIAQGRRRRVRHSLHAYLLVPPSVGESRAVLWR